MAKTIYLDESGCLGWSLDEPYKRGGSSRHFTLAAAILPDGLEPVLNRVMRGLYKKRGRDAGSELKSYRLRAGEREHFARQLADIRATHSEIEFVAITVRKEHVKANSFRRNPNGLYNFMTKLLLLQLMAREAAVAFIPDARSIRIELKHSLHDYLCTELGGMGAETFLTTTPGESKGLLALQFVDVMASIIWSHHEFKNDSAYRIAAPHVREKRLFFAPADAPPFIAPWPGLGVMPESYIAE